MIVEPGDIYKHFKGNLYVIVGKSKCTETEETLVLYAEIIDLDELCLVDHSLLWDKHPLWSRPEKMFLDNVSRGGKTFPRFERLNE